MFSSWPTDLLRFRLPGPPHQSFENRPLLPRASETPGHTALWPRIGLPSVSYRWSYPRHPRSQRCRYRSEGTVPGWLGRCLSRRQIDPLKRPCFSAPGQSPLVLSSYRMNRVPWLQPQTSRLLRRTLDQALPSRRQLYSSLSPRCYSQLLKQYLLPFPLRAARTRTPHPRTVVHGLWNEATRRASLSSPQAQKSRLSGRWWPVLGGSSIFPPVRVYGARALILPSRASSY